MNRLLVALVLSLAWAGHAAAEDRPAASAPADAKPTDAKSRAAQRALPVESPAISAVEKTQVPGDIRPERRVSPQLAVPLTPEGRVVRGRSQDARVRPAAGGIDDRAARCRAKATQAEREACERELKGKEPAGK